MRKTNPCRGAYPLEGRGGPRLQVRVESQGRCEVLPCPRFTPLATKTEWRTYAKVVADSLASRGHQKKMHEKMAQDEVHRKRGQCKYYCSGFGQTPGEGRVLLASHMVGAEEVRPVRHA